MIKKKKIGYESVKIHGKVCQKLRFGKALRKKKKILDAFKICSEKLEVISKQFHKKKLQIS